MENEYQQANNCDNNDERQEHDETNEEEEEGIINNQEYINENQELNNNNQNNNRTTGAPPYFHRIPLFMNYRRNRIFDPADDFTPRPRHLDRFLGDFPPYGRNCPRCGNHLSGSMCPFCHMISFGNGRMGFIC